MVEQCTQPGDTLSAPRTGERVVVEVEDELAVHRHAACVDVEEVAPEAAPGSCQVDGEDVVSRDTIAVLEVQDHAVRGGERSWAAWAAYASGEVGYEVLYD